MDVQKNRIEDEKEWGNLRHLAHWRKRGGVDEAESITESEAWKTDVLSEAQSTAFSMQHLLHYLTTAAK